MVSLIDPQVEEEPEEALPGEWYAVMLYDDGDGVWHLSGHPTEEEALMKLRRLVRECMGDQYEEDEAAELFGDYENWSLETMNDRMSADGETVFCIDGSKCDRGGNE